MTGRKVKKTSKLKTNQTSKVIKENDNQNKTDKKTEIEIKSGWNGDTRKKHRSFPGPTETNVPLRIAMNRQAYANITNHAHDSLDSEVCGVLIGDLCEDDHDIFIHITNIIQGVSTQQSNVHVTFTQDTWNEIHDQLEQKYPKQIIVGWYHSHPGFGVTFSDMDLFIQQNFFSSPYQCALVIDPLGGETAVCINANTNTVYIDTIWIEGREKILFNPETKNSSREGSSSTDLEIIDNLKGAFEDRLTHIIRSLEMQQKSVSRLMLTMGITAGLALIFIIGSSISNQFTNQNKPPEMIQYIPVPVKIGNDTALVGISISKWSLPPKVRAMHANLEEKQMEMLERILKESIVIKDEEIKKKNWFSKIIDFITSLFKKRKKK